jgi:NDP-sugar pyrophosphorylase family protein
MTIQQPIQHALIMAAGRGNRMRPLSDILPKAMMPYNGDTLIGNSLAMLNQCVAHVHVTVGYKRAMLSQYLMERGVNSIFNTEGHGNAWWISRTLMRHLDEPVLVLTTDNVTELDLGFLTTEYYRMCAPACMIVPVAPIPSIDGDYIDHVDGTVIHLQRQIPRPIYCSGIQVMNPARVIDLVGEDEDDFGALWNLLIARRQLKVSRIYPKAWFSIDTLAHLAHFAQATALPVPPIPVAETMPVLHSAGRYESAVRNDFHR